MSWRHSWLVAFALLAAPSSAWAQCNLNNYAPPPGGGILLGNCTLAVNPVSTDLLQGWQGGNPAGTRDRAFTLAQIQTFVLGGGGGGGPFLPLTGGTVTGALAVIGNTAVTGTLGVTGNTAITGTLGNTGTASFGTGGANHIDVSGGTNGTIAVLGGTNAQLILRSLGTGVVNIGSSTGGAAVQIQGATANGGTLLITQPAAVGTQILFDATSSNTAGFWFQPRTVIGKAVTLTNASVSPFWLNVGANVTGTQTGNVHQTMANIGSNLDTLNTDGGVNYLTVNNSLSTGWSGSRTPLKTLVTDVASTALSANDHFMIGAATRAEMKFNQGGVSTGYGTTQFGEGVAWGVVTQAVAQGTNTYFGGINGIEIDLTATAGTQILSEFGLQIVHEGVHAVQGQNFSAALMISDQVSALVGWKNLVVLGNYQSQWPLDPNGYLIQVRSNGSPLPVGAGGFDLNQMNVAGTGAEGGGFFWRSPGMKIKDTEAQVGYGTLTNNATGLLIDVTYQQMATAAGAITIAAGGTNFTTGDMVTDAYGNTLRVTAAAGVVTGISTVVTRGWQTSPPADPVAFTARTRTGTTLGSGLTLNLGAWVGQTAVTIAAATLSLPNIPTTCAAKPSKSIAAIAGVLTQCP